MKREIAFRLVMAQVGIAAVLAGMIGFTITYVCGAREGILCDNDVTVGAAIAIIVTVAALGGTNIIAWILHRAQTQADDERHRQQDERHRQQDERHRQQDERLGRIESKIDRLLGEGGGRDTA